MGRFSKSITTAQKNLMVQFTDMLIIHEQLLYCDILDFSFVRSRSEDISSYNPWMASDKIMTKSPTNKQIQAMHKDNSLSSPTPDKKSPANCQTRSKTKFVDKNIND